MAISLASLLILRLSRPWFISDQADRVGKVGQKEREIKIYHKRFV